MRRKQLRKQQDIFLLRERIVDAALTIMTQRGFYGIPLEEVAEQADLKIGTVRHFFANKEELYAALLIDHYASHDSLMRA